MEPAQEPAQALAQPRARRQLGTPLHVLLGPIPGVSAELWAAAMQDDTCHTEPRPSPEQEAITGASVVNAAFANVTETHV
jgi:hypothetical protein